MIYTDIVSGPNSGGENGKGIYLSVFGRNFGNSGLGSKVRMYINDVEVDNYRYLGPSRGRPEIQQITAQIGALGHPRPGVALPVKVTVDGAASNSDVTFTVNPGSIYFASLTGSDTRGNGTVTAPYRTVQTSGVNNNGTAGCPASSANQSVVAAGLWGLVQPGDFIVLRDGSWTDLSKDNFFLRVQNKSGSAPTGAPGTGPITIMGYPGEHALIDRSNTIGNNQRGGGISSADSARQRLGCGAWITIANLTIESGFNDGPVNTQQGVINPQGAHWRVVNNALTAISCQNNTVCKGAGVAGSGAGNYWVGNHVHDVHDKPDAFTNLENHGFYIGGDGTFEIAYNRVEFIYGGNGIQIHAPDGSVSNVDVHHNIIRDVGKHGINLADGSRNNIRIWNNLIVNTQFAGIRMGGTDLIRDLKLYNNTFYNTGMAGNSGTGAIQNEMAPVAANQVDIRNNIFVPVRRYFSSGSRNHNFATPVGPITSNLWFGGTGTNPASTFSASSVQADPKFVSRGADFHLQAGSAAIDRGSAAVSGLVTNDLDVVTSRPQGRGYDIGAYEWIR